MKPAPSGPPSPIFLQDLGHDCWIVDTLEEMQQVEKMHFHVWGLQPSPGSRRPPSYWPASQSFKI